VLSFNMAFLGPLSVLLYLQSLSRRGILIKDGRVFESVRKIDILVFDKTGTLTLEQPILSRIHTQDGFDRDAVLGFAAAAEYRQPHPIARAILAAAKEAGLDLPTPEAGDYEVGYGIKVPLDGRVIRVGSAGFMVREDIELPPDAYQAHAKAEQLGHSLVYVGVDDALAGIL
jgi:cation transport ATPase